METSEPPLFAGSVLGLRAWEVEPRVPFAATRLTAAFHGGAWRPKGDWTEAFCGAGEAHGVPHRDCSCGLYAFHPWRVAVAKLFRAHGSGVVGQGQNLTALGVIEAAGRLEVHAHGFRAERARPVALLTAATWGREIRTGLAELAELYGCELVEVTDAKSLVAYCRWRGGGLSRAQVTELLELVPDPSEVPAPLASPPPPAVVSRAFTTTRPSDPPRAPREAR